VTNRNGFRGEKDGPTPYVHSTPEKFAPSGGGASASGLFVNDTDFQLYVGDVREQLKLLPDESVHCVVTSPPYWGLRMYLEEGHASKHHELGLEPTPEQYVANMVDVFREVRRVLRRDGTCWINLGDSYIAGQGGRQSSVGEMPAATLAKTNEPRDRDDVDTGAWGARDVTAKTTPARGTTDLKPKDLAGIPWMVAFALRADGWYLRSDIVWSKPNPMPESVTDRPTKAHEYVFLLTRSPRYFFDNDAIREPHNDKAGDVSRFGNVGKNGGQQGQEQPDAFTRVDFPRRPGGREYHPAGRNIRSVWELATQPYPEAHFATFPEALPERCIRAGTSERGCCPECGAPWERVVVATGADNGRVREDVGDWIKHKGGNADGKRSRSGATYKPQRAATDDWRSTCSCADASGADDTLTNTAPAPPSLGGVDDAGAAPNPVATKGWQQSCSCDGCGTEEPHMVCTDTLNPVPCTVLDPFMGSGTVALVARRLGRRSIGVELNESYAALCARRLQQLSLFAGATDG
jgi:DNA modification methylase